MKIVIERIGSCKKCGYCCPSNCPHLKDNLCNIHADKDKFCDTCQETHSDCIESPTFPMKAGNPDCGFSFLVKGTDLEAYSILCCKYKK